MAIGSWTFSCSVHSPTHHPSTDPSLYPSTHPFFHTHLCHPSIHLISVTPSIAYAGFDAGIRHSQSSLGTQQIDTLSSPENTPAVTVQSLLTLPPCASAAVLSAPVVQPSTVRLSPSSGFLRPSGIGGGAWMQTHTCATMAVWTQVPMLNLAQLLCEHSWVTKAEARSHTWCISFRQMAEPPS